MIKLLVDFVSELVQSLLIFSVHGSSVLALILAEESFHLLFDFLWWCVWWKLKRLCSSMISNLKGEVLKR
jgi:hypothetical protein